MFKKYIPYQEYNFRISDESNGCGEFAFVAPWIGSRQFVCILCETQLLDGPASNLKTYTHRGRFTLM